MTLLHVAWPPGDADGQRDALVHPPRPARSSVGVQGLAGVGVGGRESCSRGSGVGGDPGSPRGRAE